MTVHLDAPVCPAVLDELAAALAGLPLLGEWTAEAACGPLAAAEVWTSDVVDPDELAVAERVCRRCPVRVQCRSYVLSAPVYGVWAGRCHDGTGKRQRAA